MQNDHEPVFYEPKAMSGTTGLTIRPEYAPPMSAVVQDRQTRGRPLSRAEIDAELVSHSAVVKVGRASLMLEIAAQLRDELRDIETIHTGTREERLEVVALDMARSDNNLVVLAGKHVEMAILMLRDTE